MSTHSFCSGQYRIGLTLFLVFTLLTELPPGLRAEIATLRNGMQFEGRVGKIATIGAPLAAPPAPGAVVISQIVLVDDDLRRTFFFSGQTQSVVPNHPNHERIRIEQRVAAGKRRVAAVGPILRVWPFDDRGVRIFSMNTPSGPLNIVQGMTEVTPIYTKVEGLMTQKNAYVWDMRIATSSIPRDMLSKILMRQIDPKDPDARLRMVRLYVQAERYKDASAELEGVVKEFPALANLQKQIQTLHQLSARRLIKEIEVRKQAGQHRFAYALLEKFPSEGIAGEILLRVRDMLEEYKELQEKARNTLTTLDEHVAQIKDANTRAEVQPVAAEIKAELNINTFDRLADYMRLAVDEKMTVDQKVALAISGWLLGSGSGTENLAVASSLYEVRNAVREYLNTMHQHERDEILERLEALEGSTPANLAKLISHMKPAVWTESEEGRPQGFFELTVPGLSEQPEITYYVQLPPEYDPYRRYPCVVTLNGAGTSPEQQIDWWAGAHHEKVGMRAGQGSRYGYIVVAPKWTKPHQREYEYSVREHAAVLRPLRDACRRFAIDTDRVFLSGHSMGGDAAWDISLAHPDLWAGVIPIVATAGKYVSRYWENGRSVPFYFVAGEMDGNRMATNSLDLDRYLTKHTYDVIVVVYRGRGHEYFYEEIHRIFDWMDLHRRNFFPDEFICDSMRPRDNFFWWAEVEDMPSRSMVLPINWPPDKGVRPVRTEGRILQNNRVSLRTGASSATVWLSPDMVNFDRHVAVSINGRSHRHELAPSASVLLEDVRTRGDRQHPFWAKVESQTGRAR